MRRYVHPDTFKMFEEEAVQDGLHARGRGRDGAQFSYHADQQAHAAGVVKDQ